MTSLRLVLVAGLFAAAALFTLSGARADDPPNAPSALRLGNARCPVEGAAADSRVVRRWNGVEIAFCGTRCGRRFEADPAAFAPRVVRELATQLADARARLARYEAPGPVDLANETCPVLPPAAASRDIVAEYHGMRVHVCCGNCVTKFTGDPERYLRVLREDPAMSRRIDEAEAAWAARTAR